MEFQQKPLLSSLPQLELKHFPKVRKVLGGKAALGNEQGALLPEEHEEIPGGLVHIHDVAPCVQGGGAVLLIQHVDAVIVKDIAHGMADKALVLFDEAAGGKLRQDKGAQNGDDRHDGDDGGLFVHLKIGIDADDGDEQ